MGVGSETTFHEIEETEAMIVDPLQRRLPGFVLTVPALLQNHLAIADDVVERRAQFVFEIGLQVGTGLANKRSQKPVAGLPRQE
jgi:hypothetical protein